MEIRTTELIRVSSFTFLYTAHNHARKLVEEVERGSDKDHREEVGRRGDEGSKDEDYDHRNLAVATEQARLEDSNPGKEIGHHRHLEHQSHSEHHADEGADVGIERYLVDYAVTDLIIAKKIERERKNQKVCQRKPQKELEEECSNSSHGGFALLGVESR